MTEYTVQQLDYCINKYELYNKYDGWCHYYDKDTCEISLTQCDIIKKSDLNEYG